MRIVAIASIAAVVAVAPASASFPGHNGVIVFSSLRKDGSLEIFSMRPNGSSVTRLTRDHPLGSRPTWSPNGKRIAFIADSYAGTELWAMRRDGTGLVRLARGAAHETPAWSPNGRRIAFACPAGRSETTLCLVRSNGTGRKRITRPRGDQEDGHPTWSPDGKEIAFDRLTGSHSDIFALTMRTGRVRRLAKTRGDNFATDPSWSRQGRIAYEYARFGNDEKSSGSDIFVMRPDGSGKRNVTRTYPGSEWPGAPTWSPNGEQIVFTESEGFFVINADGSGRHRLAFDTGYPSAGGYGNPAWSPDGGKIAFDDDGVIWLGNSDGNGAEPLLRGDSAKQPAVTADGSTIAFHSPRGEFVMSSDGTNLRQLSGDYWSGRTADPVGGAHPSWSPDGQRLAVEITDDAGYADGIDLVDIDGSHYDGIADATGWPDYEGQPAWSPDGTRIAFTANYGSGSDVCVFVLATSRSGCFTRRGSDSEPTWSPDGTKIAFARGNGIDVMNANGKDVHKLIANANQPAWSPDGRKIAFVRYLGRNSEIYVVNVNGTGLKRLTHNPGPDLYPDWQPVAT